MLPSKQENSSFRSRSAFLGEKMFILSEGKWNHLKQKRCTGDVRREEESCRSADWGDRGGRIRTSLSCGSFSESLPPCVCRAEPWKGRATEAGTGAAEWWGSGFSGGGGTPAAGARKWGAPGSPSSHPAGAAAGSPGPTPSRCRSRARSRCLSCSRSDPLSPGQSLTPGPASRPLSARRGSAGRSLSQLRGWRLLGPDSSLSWGGWPPPSPSPPESPRSRYLSVPSSGRLDTGAGRVGLADHPLCRLYHQFAPSPRHRRAQGGAVRRRGEAAGTGCSAKGWGKTGRGRGSQGAVWGSCWGRRPLGGRGWSPRDSQKVGCEGTGPAGTGAWSSTGHLQQREEAEMEVNSQRGQRFPDIQDPRVFTNYSQYLQFKSGATGANSGTVFLSTHTHTHKNWWFIYACQKCVHTAATQIWAQRFCTAVRSDQIEIWQQIISVLRKKYIYKLEF